MVLFAGVHAALPLSVDHKPNRQDERTRIENAGGVVVWAGTWRVGGVLAVSRAFGDRLLKRYVVATPDITEETVGPDDQLVVLASDGLWDVVSNDDAVNLIKDIKVRLLCVPCALGFLDFWACTMQGIMLGRGLS